MKLTMLYYYYDRYTTTVEVTTDIVEESYDRGGRDE